LQLTKFISPSGKTALIMPQRFCEEKLFLLIFVASGLNNFLRRQAIRRTWANSSIFNYPEYSKMHGHLKEFFLPYSRQRVEHYAGYLSVENNSLRAFVKVVFIVGRSKFKRRKDLKNNRKLIKEAAQHNDIIQEDFIDTYHNLTLKTMMAVKHITNMCSETAYVFKTDDDAFVNVPNLLHILLGGTVPAYENQQRLNATLGVLMGLLTTKDVPNGNLNSKFYMPYYMYPNNTLIPHVFGGGYLMSIDVVRRLYSAAWNTKINFLEDFYLTGLCAQKANVKILNNLLFSKVFSSHLCDYKDTIIRTDLSVSNIYKVWDFVTNFNMKCPPGNLSRIKFKLIREDNC
ncbi:hypothetical protein KR067_009881, partial [Drosophila pandora]